MAIKTFREAAHEDGQTLVDKLKRLSIPGCEEGEEPADLEPGTMFWNTTSDLPRIRNNAGDFVDIAAGGTVPNLNPKRFLARKAVGSTPASGVTSTEALDILDADDVRARNVLRGQIVNVKAYGAAGDGVTDDTSAILAAIAATPEAGVLWLPTGNYKLSNELVIDHSMRVLGDCRTSLTQTNPAKPIWRVATDSSDDIIQFSFMTLAGGTCGIHWDSSAGGPTTAGLNAACSMDRMTFSGSTFAGVRIDLTIEGSRHDYLFFTGCRYGVYVNQEITEDRTDFIGNTTWTNCNFAACTDTGFHANQLIGGIQNSVILINPTFQGCSKIGLYAQASRVHLIAPHFEANGGAGNGTSTIYPDISIGAGGAEVLVLGGVFSAEPNDHQGTPPVRVRFEDNNARFISIGTNFHAGVVDGNNKGGSAFIQHIGGLGAPGIINDLGFASSMQIGPAYRVRSVEFSDLAAVSGPMILSGAGTPEGTINAPLGSLYLRTNGSELASTAGYYYKAAGASGNTGWRYLSDFHQGVSIRPSDGAAHLFLVNTSIDGGYTPATPATPEGYFQIYVNGTPKLVPYFAVS